MDRCLFKFHSELWGLYSSQKQKRRMQPTVQPFFLSLEGTARSKDALRKIWQPPRPDDRASPEPQTLINTPFQSIAYKLRPAPPASSLWQLQLCHKLSSTGREMPPMQGSGAIFVTGETGVLGNPGKLVFAKFCGGKTCPSYKAAAQLRKHRAEEGDTCGYRLAVRGRNGAEVGGTHGCMQMWLKESWMWPRQSSLSCFLPLSLSRDFIIE